ncbi:MAG: lysophospholipase [Negativicutes bacterium]|nr:lysophospholipase [Negativicutes bacterium]
MNIADARRSLGGPLLLADEGVLFVNGKMIASNYPTAPDKGEPPSGEYAVNQMYVHYRIPVKMEHKYPIVMVHGSGLTGVTYETTPDGREGWATYFTRMGFAVYVVDHPGRGRSGFDPAAINQAKMGKFDLAKISGGIPRWTIEMMWPVFRFGPKYPEAYPDSQYPLEALAALSAQGVPQTELLLDGGAIGTTPPALAALLDEIGPAILLVHSQSGPFADRVVGMHPNLVKGVINIEGNQLTIPTDAEIAAYQTVPEIEVFGDHVIGSPVSTGQNRYDVRSAVVARINAAGGEAQILQLPEIGLHGNSHMMMQEKNNLQIADYLIKWIKEKVE